MVSNTLNEIHWKQPTAYSLMDEMLWKLSQYSTSPRYEKIIQSSKIWLLIAETQKLAEDVDDRLVALKLETIRDRREDEFQTAIAEIQSRVPTFISEILSSDNYEISEKKIA